jgi:signal transduction histidine kinase
MQKRDKISSRNNYQVTPVKSVKGFKAIIYIALVAVFINILYSVIGSNKDYFGAIMLSCGFVALCFVLWIYNRGKLEAAKIIGAILINILLFIVTNHLGLESGSVVYFFPFIISFLYIFRDGGSSRKTFLFFLITTFTMVFTLVYVPGRPEGLILPDESIDRIRTMSLIISFLLTSYVFYALFQYQKELYEALVLNERNHKIEVMRSVMNSQEKEREVLVEGLQSSVYQSLATSKLMLQDMSEKDNKNVFLQKSLSLTKEAMTELYSICYTLNPSTIRDIGLEEGLQEYIANYTTHFQKSIQVSGNFSQIETIPVIDKVSLFRIVQDYLLIYSTNESTSTISINFDFLTPNMLITFQQNDSHFFLSNGKEQFLRDDLNNRIDYYRGNTSEREKNESLETIFRLVIS